jgi:glycerate dehydrogenase
MMKKSEATCCLLDGYTTNPGDLNWGGLEKRVDLKVYDRTAPHETVQRAKGCRGVLTNKVLITREILDQLPECEAVFLLSTGVNVVDLEACSERGIPVCNIPAYSTASVAELVFAYLFDWARGVQAHATAVRGGEWAGCEDFTFTRTPQRELSECTLGLVGFGEIAQSVAHSARTFGLKVLATTPHPDGKPDLGQEFVALDELVEASDVVSLHCPLTGETDRLMNGERFGRMKKGAVLINTGRGGLVDEEALADALRSGQLGAAYLDVLSAEPPPEDHPLTSLEQAVITPHIAWSTRAARQRLVNELCANVFAWLDGEPRNVVNHV